MHFGRRRFESVLESLGDENPITLRALIPNKMVGSLIGKQGYIHKQIQDIFNVHVYILAWGDQYGRLTSVFGSASSVSQAWRDALFRMHGSGEGMFYGQLFQIAFLIPAPLVNHMIKSNFLEKIHNETKTGIQLKGAPMENTTDHLLTITIGSMEVALLNSFEKAVNMLALQFQENPDKAMSPYNIYYLPPTQDECTTPSCLSQSSIQNDAFSSTMAEGGGDGGEGERGDGDGEGEQERGEREYFDYQENEQDNNNSNIYNDDITSTLTNINNSNISISMSHSDSSIKTSNSNDIGINNDEKKKLDIIFPLGVDDQQWHEEFNYEPITPN
ncbi:hypothetical protein INT45_004693 [Circinella minor]|uniref:K Homology domain-containing protein n=1 Tax=Circinella minor TaxID=1195481 RepID=A0A8H7SEJ0_9FUNG|nr:hypothetical protein INT45_004693 [Circinella minor]